MSKGGCKLSHHAIQIVKIVPCRPCPWKTGKLGRNNTCHKFVLAWWHGNNENRACKQVRFHSILDGSSLAHAIQVLMGPLLMNYGRMRCTFMKRLLGTELDTHTHTSTDTSRHTFHILSPTCLPTNLCTYISHTHAPTNLPTMYMRTYLLTRSCPCVYIVHTDGHADGGRLDGLKHSQHCMPGCLHMFTYHVCSDHLRSWFTCWHTHIMPLHENTQTYRPEHIHTVHSTSALSSFTIQNIWKNKCYCFRCFQVTSSTACNTQQQNAWY